MELPNELIIEISSYLKISDIFSNRLISKDWYHVTDDDVLWSKLMKRDFDRHKPNKNKEFYIFTHGYLLDKISIKFDDIEKHSFSTLDTITYIERNGFVRKKNRWIYYPNIENLINKYDITYSENLSYVKDNKSYNVMKKLLSNYFKGEVTYFSISNENLKHIYDFLYGKGRFDKDFKIGCNSFTSGLMETMKRYQIK